MLAQNLALRNPELSQRDLNFAVQRTIDRIIFLRICEDRGIEEYGRLRDLKEGKGVYERLVQMYHQADARYNSGLFHFRKEKGEAESPDLLTPDLKIDDRVLHEIARRLYYPDSPYEFSVFSSSILGHVYERFLGKVIVLDKKHKATVEEKPEVRKAGGVYYTPDYISKYIVENTVGKLVENREPKDVSEIRVLDPACGSGSFLLAAYDFLLDWHLRYYLKNDPDAIGRKKAAPIFRVVGADGSESWRLTTNEKRRILLNNIYGVDIDQQAVEVTKLSLLLKVLEGESEQTLGSQMALLHQRVLPDLGNNIKSGNSLIGPEFYDAVGYAAFSPDERASINAFDWVREFSEVMRGGGFDVVIGNPPYVRQESISALKRYLAASYISFDSTADLFVYFIERGTQLLREGGRFGVIVSSSILRAAYGTRLRSYLTTATKIESLVDFGGLPVFRDAKDTYVCIPILSKGKQTGLTSVIRPSDLGHEALLQATHHLAYEVPAGRLEPDGWNLATDSYVRTFEHLLRNGDPLSSVVGDRIFRGVLTGMSAAFEIEAGRREAIITMSPPSAELIHPVLGGQDIRRYHVRGVERYLIVMPNGWTRHQMGGPVPSEETAWEWLSNEHSGLAQHLEGFRAALKKRHDKGEFWWELRPCDYYHVFEGEKIIFPDICKGPRFHLDREGRYFTNTAYALGIADPFLLAVLNSRVFWFAISHISIPLGMRAGQYRYRMFFQYMARVPICRIDTSSPEAVAKRELVIRLVGEMQTLLQTVHGGASTPGEQARHRREIASIDSRLDSLIYDFYNLHPQQIAVIEEATTGLDGGCL